jgi:hypothetical protein
VIGADRTGDDAARLVRMIGARVRNDRITDR